ncbi:MAG: hypothetical protein R3E65_09300 [Steroidobacteraceae bacterium]
MIPTKTEGAAAANGAAARAQGGKFDGFAVRDCRPSTRLAGRPDTTPKRRNLSRQINGLIKAAAAIWPAEGGAGVHGEHRSSRSTTTTIRTSSTFDGGTI